jgi:two-component system sensor histidine kinase/response regulator
VDINRTVHDLRNDLAVATASVQAFADAKLEPNRENLEVVLESLQSINAFVSQLADAARQGSSGGLLKLVIEGSPFAKVLVDSRGDIVLVNRETEQLFGYSREELLGHSVEELVPERFKSGHPALRRAYSLDPVPRPMGAGRELFGRRKDGSEVPIEIALNPLATEQGRFVLAAIVDITERKRAEELRLQNRELESASFFKTQFVATMSHELRTPLTAIIGAAELLTRAPLDSRSAVSVDTINEAADALLALINNVLDFSKIEAGKMDFERAPFQVENVLGSIAAMAAQLGREKGVAVYTYVDPAIPPIVGDAKRLSQVLLNLLGNAVKFTQQGRVFARALWLSDSNEEVAIRFEVQDTGIGIPAEMLPNLFQPFVRAEAASKFAGTGLGLSISRRLVEMMGGQIGVESTLAVGSRFWFTLRFPRSADAAARPQHSLDGLGGFVVSDDDVFAQIIERYLESWQMSSARVRNKRDIEETLRADGRHGEWVAIVDADSKTNRSALEAADALRSRLPTRVIAIGENEVVHKPVKQSILFDAIVRASQTLAPQSKGAGSGDPEPESAALEVAAPVLVAEDNQRLQRLLKLQFEELGVPVEFVSDGRQAVDAARNGTYSMVFMDFQMPNLDGLSAAREIRKGERATGRHIPIAAMTADAFAEDREACVAAGMDDYLAKPVKLADLRRLIARWAPRPAGA